MNKPWKFIGSFLFSYFLVLIPVLLVTLWASNNTMERLTENTHASIQDRAELVGAELEQMVADYAQSSVALANESELQGDFWYNNYRRYTAKQRISSIFSYDRSLSDLMLHHPKQGVYSVQGYSNEISYLSNTLKLTQESVEHARKVLVNPQKGVCSLRVTNSETGGYLLIHFPDYELAPSAGFSTNYIVSFQQLGEKLRGVSYGGSLYVRLILADESTICFEDVQGEITPSKTVNPEDMPDYTAISTRIPAMNAQLELLYNTEELYAPVSQGQELHLRIIIVGLLASTAVSLWLAARRMKNLQLLGRAAQGEPVNFRRQNEYAFIGGLLSDSAQEIRSLSEGIEKHGDTIRLQTVQLILNGGVKDWDTASQLLQSSGLDWNEEFYFVGSIAFDAEESLWSALPQRMRHERVCLVEWGGQRSVAFLGEVPSLDEKQEKRMETARRFESLLMKAGAQNVRIGMSRVYRDLALVSLAYGEAAESLGEGIVCYENLPARQQQVLQPDQEALSRFAKSLRMQDLKKAQDVFADMAQQIENAPCDEANREFLRTCILQTLLSSIGDGDNEELVQSVIDVNVQDGGKYAAQTARLLRKYVQQPERGQDLRTSLVYIQENYADPNLSAADVAAFSGVNKAHLGRLFKAELGKTYIEYLSEVRLSKARELLATTDLPISEIARQVGYYDHSSFRRKFKSQLGVDVTEYRKQFQRI